MNLSIQKEFNSTLIQKLHKIEMKGHKQHTSSRKLSIVCHSLD